VRRHAALLTILAGHASVSALALVYHLRARVAVVDAFERYGTEMPAATALALSTWFVPTAVGIGLATAILALLLPIGRRRRLGLAASGVIVSASALVFAVLSAFGPVFRPIE